VVTPSASGHVPATAEGLETVTCNCCGGRRHRLVYRQPDTLFHQHDWFDVVECLDCGLGFVNPRPTAAAISHYYPAAFFDGFDDVEQHRARYEVEAGFLPAVRPERSPPRLLDIGCANGDFPRVMRARGWKVEGIETSPNARPIDDFPVHRAPLDTLDLPGESYDAITAWAVLEHVHDPAAYFRAAGRLLKPGGRFVFLVTNFDSLSSRRLFREDVPRHLVFFTEATVGRYLDAAGLAMVRAVHTRRVYEMRPSNCLYYGWRRLSGRRLEWQHLPEPYHGYCARTGRRPGRAALVLYAATHPVAVADRLAALVYERWQLWTRRYGIVVYVAERPVA
jgi:SAM-dependent methyltransferase